MRVRPHHVILVSATLLPVLLCAMAAMDWAMDDARREAEARFLSDARSIAQSVDRMIAEEVAALSTLTQAPSLDDGDLTAFRGFAERAVAHRDSWAGIVLTDHGRQVLNTRLPLDAPLGGLDRIPEIARVYETGREQMSGIVRAPDRYLHPFVHIDTPVVRDDTVRYVLLCKIPAWTFRDLLRGRTSPDGQAGIIDQKDRIVAHNTAVDPADPVVGSRAPTTMLGGERRPSGLFANLSTDGGRMLTALAAAPRYGWRVALVEPAGVIEAPLAHLRLLMTGLGALALALAGMAATAAAILFRRHTGALAPGARLAEAAARAPGLLHRHVLHPDGRIATAFVGGALAPTAAPVSGGGNVTASPSPRLERALRESAATLAPVSLDEPSADGRRWLRVAAVPHRGSDGTVVWDGLSIDVTDLRAGEAELRDRAERMRMAQEAAGMGSWDWDPSTGRILWSEGLYRILGLRPDTAALDVPDFLDRCVHPDDRQMVLAETQRATLRSGSLRIEYRVRHSDGSLRWLECVGNSVANAEGRPVRLLGIVRDVTERKAMEEALHAANLALEREIAKHRRIEAVLESIYATAPAGMCVIDDRMRYLHINDRLANYNGQTAAEHIGRTIRDMVPPALADSIEPLYRRVLRTGEPLHDHVAGGPTPRDPSIESQYLFNLHPLRLSDGTVYAVNAIVQDVTERRTMESALRTALEDARAANAAKARFFAAASHDLRQPVQTLFLFTYALNERLREHPAQTLVGTMQQALEGMKGLIDTLLDISRLDSGTLAVEPADFPAVTLMQRLSADYAPRMAAKGLRFRMVGNPAWIHSDSILLGRILGNLLDNALKYTETGSVLLSCRRRGAHARIEVWDTGSGIAPEDQAAIFDEFVQVGPSRRDGSRGLGLGLSIVQRLSSLLGHEVTLRSVPGRGTVFSVMVPLAAEAGDSARPPPLLVAADKEGPPLVLMMDDDRTILEALGMLLGEWGFETIGAATPEDALNQIAQRRRRPDVIIADYHLPDGRTGIDAIRQIRAYCNSPVPAIVLTGDTGPDRAQEVGRIGSHLLQKPVLPDLLQDMIQRLAGAPRRGSEKNAG